VNQTSRLEHFPISFFAVIMGLAGLTPAWEKAQSVFQIDLHINAILVTATGLAVSRRKVCQPET